MELKVNLNQKRIGSLGEFCIYDNRCNNMQKDTVFVIQLGDTQDNLLRVLTDTDAALTARAADRGPAYLRTGLFDSYMEAEEKQRYQAMYEGWNSAATGKPRGQMKVPFAFENALWETTFRNAFSAISKEYSQVKNSELKTRNFLMVMLHWIAKYFPLLFTSTKSLSKFPKLIYTGRLRDQEFLFLRLLAMCGCDVYCIYPELQLECRWENLSFWAQILTGCGELSVSIPPYGAVQALARWRQMESAGVQESWAVRPKTEDKPVRVSARESKRTTSLKAKKPMKGMTATDRILEYEELAERASSIVMITVLDRNQKPFATGSGILVHKDGYILTNFHVVKEGAAYAIRLEEEEEIQVTSELVKYHPVYDLALLRIQPPGRPPIPLYQGSSLARGQKVAAIGSPLGLFNTVSDGIIAGFRLLDEVSMIQFTAPTSHGSSGGALLDLYGRLIGVVTGGYEEGQNLNLAVDYRIIREFLRGFLS